MRCAAAWPQAATALTAASGAPEQASRCLFQQASTHVQQMCNERGNLSMRSPQVQVLQVLQGSQAVGAAWQSAGCSRARQWTRAAAASRSTQLPASRCHRRGPACGCARAPATAPVMQHDNNDVDSEIHTPAPVMPSRVNFVPQQQLLLCGHDRSETDVSGMQCRCVPICSQDRSVREI